MRRHVLVHHHIFKNAGTTFDLALSQCFGRAFVELVPNYKTNKIHPFHLLDFLHKNADISCVSSHNFVCTMLDEDISGDFFADFPLSQAIMIRHPVARLLSMYAFYKKSNHSGELEENAKSASAREFIKLMMEKFPQIANNSQVVTLSLGGKYAPPGDRDLEIAALRIKKLNLVGTVERYNETMVCGEYFLAPVFGDINLCAAPMNVTTPLTTFDENSKLADAKNLLGADVFDHLLSMNELDHRLWQIASAELDRRIRLIPSWGEN